MTMMQAIQKLMREYFYVTADGEIDWAIQGFTLDQIDPELASELAKYLNYQQKRDRKKALTLTVKQENLTCQN